MIKNILKGMVIGIANIIPGVSGGTMMVAMGIYDKLIHCITHLFSEFKKSVKFVLPIGIGMVLGIVLLSQLIGLMFAHFPIQTNLLFIGLILGGLPAIYGNVKGQTIRLGHIAAFLVFFCLVVGMAAVGEVDKAGSVLTQILDFGRKILSLVWEGDKTGSILTLNFVNCIILFVVGVIAAATMVIPGVSGSMVLMLLGYYNFIIDTINQVVYSLIAFDINGIMQGAFILVPFGIGVVIGIFAVAKLVEIIFKKFPNYAYWAIIGLIVASPFAIVMLNDFSGINVISILTGIVALIAGAVVALKLGKE